MYSKFDPQFDSFDSRREETERQERAAEEAATFAAMTSDQQEEFIQAERLVYLAAERARITRRAPVTMNVALIGNGLYVRVGKRVA